jgi:hypothetical protein
MKRIIVFLLFVLICLAGLLCTYLAGVMPSWMEPIRLWFFCTLAGGIGGCVYCLRGVYLNACVHKRWDPEWQPWYYIRPFVSLVCGAASCLFLKAGLLVLESTQKENSTDLGFLGLAFVAGLNVDNFLAKVEEIAKATWGIERSRAGKESPKETK